MSVEEQSIQAADSLPMSLGRKSGCTAREFRKRLDDYLRKKHMPSYPFGKPRRAKKMVPKKKP